MGAQAGRAASIFDAAVELATAAERAAYLDAACGPDAELRAEVEGLLQHDSAAGSFLDLSARPNPQATVDEPAAAERPGMVIGPYKLLEQIGEGGFGVVFMAEQQEPVRRKVALKVLKPGMDSRQVVARFEAERQALALMDHPNIAKVLDGGQTASGRPYFVMDLVKGVPITDYCDQAQLTTNERLGLFVHVCQAVQHAHQKGIIHRDLKPSNVLVTLHDGTPVVKVIDFGIAKALGQQLTDKTLFTGFAQMIGTPLYMSPEQAALSSLDVDTRSDIYSLGVLLYELLTGMTPFDKERLRQADYDELRRIIREEDPPRPSTRLSTLGQAAVTISARRQSDPRRLSQLFKGELDWVVMKALEKDRGRRYESASAFAADVQHYLHDEPVLACPPSAWYRLRKVARRNRARLMVTGVVLLCIVLLGGSAGWTVLDRVARRAEAVVRAGDALEEVVRLQGQQKWAQAAGAARRAEDLLAGGGGPEAVRQQARGLREDMEMAARLEDCRLQEAAVKDWFFDASRLDRAYATAFREYGLDVEQLSAQEAGERMAARSIRVQLAAALDDWARAARGARRPGGEGWKHLLAVARVADPDGWRNRFRDAWARWDRKSLEGLGTSAPVAKLPAPTLVALSLALNQVGAREPALALLRQAQRQYPDDLWTNHSLAFQLANDTSPPRPEEAIGFYRAAVALRPQSPGVRLNLGMALERTRRLDEASAEYREALRLKPGYAEAHSNLGATLAGKGQLEEAIAECREALRLKQDYPDAHNNLGAALANKGRLDEAIAAFRQAVRLKPGDATFHCGLGNALSEKGRLDEAITESRTAIRLKPDFAKAHSNLGGALSVQGKLPEAVAALRKAVELDPNLADAHNNLGAALAKQGKLKEAIAACYKAIGLKPNDAVMHFNLAILLREQGTLTQALAEFRKAIELKPDFAEAYRDLGLLLHRQGQPDQAMAAFRKVIELKPNDANAYNHLAACLREQGHLADASAAVRKALALKPDLSDAHHNLGVLLYQQGQPDQAIAAFRKAVELKPDGAQTHFDLAAVLRVRGRPDEAIAEYRATIALEPENGSAHCELGLALRQKGQFAEALQAFRRGHELGSKQPGWRYPSAQWVHHAEQLVALAAKLPKILEGKVEPADAAERVALARLCQHYRKQYAAAARF
jgi:tetratricopeptide (TPR) repeat protein/serine/threonine protein kinase